QTTKLRLLAQSGLVLKPQPMTGLRQLGEPSPSELIYQAAQPGYTGSVLVEAAGPLATARVLTFVEVVDRQLKFQALVSCRIPQGELRTLTVRLHGWEGPVELTAERVAQRRDRGEQSRGERSWALDLQPGTTREYAVALSGTIPVDDLTG